MLNALISPLCYQYMLCLCVFMWWAMIYISFQFTSLYIENNCIRELHQRCLISTWPLLNFLNLFMYLFTGHTLRRVWSSFLDQGLNSRPLHWKHRVLITGLQGKSLDHYLDGQNLVLKLELHALRRCHFWIALGMRIFGLQGNVNSLCLMVNHGWLMMTTNYSKGFTLRTVVLLDPGGSCDCSGQYSTLEMMLSGWILIRPVSWAFSLGALSCHVRCLEAAVLQGPLMGAQQPQLSTLFQTLKPG